MDNENKYNVEDLNEYIRQGEPGQREKALAWQTAIGLQAVDGLKPSKYLLDTARRNIEGEITTDEVRRLVDSYYQNKTIRTANDKDMEEADKVSANINKILSTDTFAFTFNGFVSIHRRLFDGVLIHAGKLRKYDISKKEWVLRGDSVHYLNWEDLERAIDYDLQQEKAFSYRGLSETEKVSHICRFVSGLWQIHPFGEGNTRTTAVFAIQYLRSIGYQVTNNMFADHSWYFRNALVRANYKNVKLEIDYDFSFLEKFFGNLLLGEQHDLKNRYMLIQAPSEWQGTDDKKMPTDDKPTITDDKLESILSFLKENGPSRRRDISAMLGLKPTQTKAYLYKLIEQGKIVAHGANRNRTYSLA